MANRFGRQQKRKMRAQFAAVATTNAKLSESLAITKLVMANQSHKIMQLQGEIDRAKQIIGHHSALFAPTGLTMGGKERGFVNIPVKKWADPDYTEYSLSAESSILNERIMFTSLDILLSDTRINYPDFGYHCMVNFGGKRWGYAANEKAITTIPRMELVELMANSLARQIVDDLKSNKAR